MVFATVLWASRCARYEAMLAAAQAAEDESRTAGQRPGATCDSRPLS